MSLQSIINISNGLEINRRRLLGVQYTRNELPRVSETPTFNPWKLTVTTPNSLRYNDARHILEALDLQDRRTPSLITFSNNPNLSWMFRYLGEATTAQRNTITFNSFTGNQLLLNVSSISTLSSGLLIFKAGDIFQVEGFPYPFTSTTDVTRGLGDTITVTTHRPNIFSTQPTSGTGINFGNDVVFNVFCPNMPTYKLIPGGYQRVGGVTLNNAYIEFSSEFLMYEYVASA